MRARFAIATACQPGRRSLARTISSRPKERQKFQKIRPFCAHAVRRNARRHACLGHGASVVIEVYKCGCLYKSNRVDPCMSCPRTRPGGGAHTPAKMRDAKGAALGPPAASNQETRGGCRFSRPLITLAVSMMSPSLTSDSSRAPSTVYPKQEYLPSSKFFPAGVKSESKRSQNH